VIIFISIIFFQTYGVFYTNPDDIDLVLKLSVDPIRGSISYAIENARIWLIPYSALSYYCQYSQLSDYIRIFINITTTYVIFSTIKINLSKSVAIYWIIVYLTLCPFTWFYNILVSYVGFYFWCCSIGLSLIFLKKYLDHQYETLRANALLSGFIFTYLYSIISYEIFALIEIFLVSLILLQDVILKRNKSFIIRSIVKLLAIITVCYAAAYITWSQLFKIDYMGTTLSLLNIDRAIATGYSLAINGSTLGYILNPYSLTFSSVLDGNSERHFFHINLFLEYIWENYPYQIFYAASSLLIIFLIFSNKESLQKNKSTFICITSTLFAMFCAIAPIALSPKYQLWVLNNGVKSYTPSIVALIFISLAISLLLNYLLNKASSLKIFYLISKTTLAATLILFLSATFFINWNFLENMRLDNRRWSAIDTLFKTEFSKNKLFNENSVYAPRLSDFAWWLNISKLANGAYWKDYTKIFYKEINFTDKGANSLLTFDFYGNNPDYLLIHDKNSYKENFSEIILIVDKDNTNTALLEEATSGKMNLLKKSESFCNKYVCEYLYRGQYNINNIYSIVHGEKKIKIEITK
jgi:hypothetical protein